MSFGLGHGRKLDPGEGIVAVSPDELGPLPDTILEDPESGRVDPRRWFPNPSHRFEIEIGSGKGTFLLQQAELEPKTNFLGIEWANEFFTYAADRIRRRRKTGTHTNVRMLHADASEFLRWRCPSDIVRVVHLYFSDPWPKQRHHKKRVIQHAMLAETWRVLTPGGELRVVTDHDELWAWDVAHFAKWSSGSDTLGVGQLPDIPGIPDAITDLRDGMPDPAFEVLAFDRPESADDGEIVGTNFERKFRRQGRSFHACTLRKISR